MPRDQTEHPMTKIEQVREAIEACIDRLPDIPSYQKCKDAIAILKDMEAQERVDEGRPLSYFMRNTLWWFDNPEQRTAVGTPKDQETVPRTTVESWLESAERMESSLRSLRSAAQVAADALHRRGHMISCSSFKPFAGRGGRHTCDCLQDTALSGLRALGITPTPKP